MKIKQLLFPAALLLGLFLSANQCGSEQENKNEKPSGTDSLVKATALLRDSLNQYGVSVAGPLPEGLTIGAKAPDFKLPDQIGDTICLDSLNRNGYGLLIFYQGYLRPAAADPLRNIQDSLLILKDAGLYKVVAACADPVELIDSLVAQQLILFPILRDTLFELADSYDVDYQLDSAYFEKLKKKYPSRFAQYPKGAKPQRKTVVQAAYVIDRSGKIAWRRFDYNPKQPPRVKNILNAIDSLRALAPGS